MSYSLKDDVLFYQRLLKSAGFYHEILDGDWGPNTNKADAEFIAASKAIAAELGTFDTRSENNINALAPKAQREARKFLKLALATGTDVRLISGTRTYEEQNALYNKGRNGNPGNKVTNAKGGQSNHNFGIAWDIGIFGSNGAYIENDAKYIELAGKVLPHLSTIEWGGNWHSMKDYPHYQLKAATSDIAQLQHLFENGQSYV